MVNESLLRKYGKFIRPASEASERRKFSLGPLSINYAVGHPEGIESGKLIQIIGRESSGKSTLALDIARQAIEDHNYPVFYIDFERTFDREYAQQMGIDLDRLFVVNAPTTEKGFEITEEAISSDTTKLVIIDSFPAARPSSEDDRAFDQSPKMASNAGLLTRFCNRLPALLYDNDALLIGINQLRANFSTLSPVEAIPWGGRALQYAVSVSIDLRRTKKEDDRITIAATVAKNKLGAPYKTVELCINFGQGFDHAADILNLALRFGIVQQRGAWYTYHDEKVQGIQGAKSFDLIKIKAEVLDKMKGL